ncbi:hypothetical protein ACQ86N_37845 [Puia sp. P3]|uniref:hypothetical protein n=1 Tax=Puia sp. P3 TaxID=3423952 RepID=UPI003D67B5D3
MRATIPQFQTAAYDLSFNDSISVYRAAPKDEAPDPFEPSGGGNRIVMRFGGPGDDGVLYENHASGRLLEESTLEDKKYLVSDTVGGLSWKLSEETASVLGHSCKKQRPQVCAEASWSPGTAAISPPPSDRKNSAGCREPSSASTPTAEASFSARFG